MPVKFVESSILKSILNQKNPENFKILKIRVESFRDTDIVFIFQFFEEDMYLYGY